MFSVEGKKGKEQGSKLNVKEVLGEAFISFFVDLLAGYRYASFDSLSHSSTFYSSCCLFCCF